MQTARRNSFAQRHLVWLLWLVLLLPLAQTVASWHLVSHLPTTRLTQSEDPHAINPTDCTLCTSAAALIGGALLATAPAQTQTIGRFEAPIAVPIGVATTPTTIAYESRAPPFQPH
jgi:ABC-type sulfate transport system permease component